MSWIADLIGSALKSFVEWIISMASYIASSVWDALQWVWNSMVSAIQSAIEGFISWSVNNITATWERLRGAVTTIMSWLVSGAMFVAQQLLQGFSFFITWALDIMETAWRRFYELVRDFGNTLWLNSLNILKTLVINPLWGLFETLLNKVRERLFGAIMIITVTPIVIRGVKQVAQGKIRSGLNTIIFGPIAGGIASFILYGIVAGFVPQNPIKLPEIFPTTEQTT